MSVLLCAVAGLTIPPPSAVHAQTTEVTIEDFSDLVTVGDAGFDDFGGNMGTLNPRDRAYATTTPVAGPPAALRLAWSFDPADAGAYTGYFLSLFGLTMTKATFDGTTVEDLAFPEHSLDLDRIDGALEEPGGPRRVDSLGIDLVYTGAQTLTLRLELKDAGQGVRFRRFAVAPSAQQQRVDWSFRTDFQEVGAAPFDVHRAKLVSAVIEREHVGDGVRNPDQGSVDLRRVAASVTGGNPVPTDAAGLLDVQERRACQYFLDWSSRKPASLGMPQDRSTFGDLLTVGGAGFALPGYAVCAERGWVSRSEAATRAVSVLRCLDAPDRFGPEPVGRVGYKGFLYHFLGVDCRRKLNFDFSTTPDVDESKNTVELSTIDTALAVMGALAAQSYFTGTGPVEAEIRQRAQAVADRVDWRFMFDPGTKRLYLGWKPNEPGRTGPKFTIPDADGTGAYSARDDGSPATLDYYTDEALIAALLANSSATHPVADDLLCSIIRTPKPNGLVPSYPGALFTYQFLHAFVDTRGLVLPSCGVQPQLDVYANSRLAMTTARSEATANASHLPTYGSTAWGVSAAEGPDDAYRAYGLPALAANPTPEQDGTISYYGMVSAAAFGDDLRDAAASAVQAAVGRGHLHPRFGLVDAFTSDVSRAASCGNPSIVRCSGPWAQHVGFAIDQGPMLLHLENARSGLVWRLLASNPNLHLPPPSPSFTALTPARILDTRTPVGGHPAKVGSQETAAVTVTGVGGVPASGVAAVVMNVTATEASASTWLTVFPTGAPRPNASNLNVVPNQDVPNLVVAKVGADGKVNLFNNQGAVHVIFDVVGWYAPSPSFTALTPARILDTRTAVGGHPAKVGSQETAAVTVTGVGGVPASGVAAVVMNVTATEASASTWLTVFPTGAPRPNASNLNVVPNQDVPNLVVAKVGADGKVNLFNNQGAVHVIFDVVGWYAP